MTGRNTRVNEAEQLRLKLVGKPLVGFDTRHWSTVARDGAVKGRAGNKVGIKGSPA